MIKELLRNWHWMRFIRLTLGIYIAVEAIQHWDAFTGSIVLFFLYQAFANVGCSTGGSCSTGNCSVPQNRSNESSNEVIFEEVK
jgi:hypothetical protein